MDYHDRAKGMYERTMELVFIQVDNVQDELESLALLIQEIEDEELREKMDKYVIRAMTNLERI